MAPKASGPYPIANVPPAVGHGRAAVATAPAVVAAAGAAPRAVPAGAGTGPGVCVVSAGAAVRAGPVAGERERVSE